MFSFYKKSKLNDDMLNHIEEMLILSDIGIQASSSIVNQLKDKKFNKDISMEELKFFVKSYISEILTKYEKNINVIKTPFVILIFGTNGSGKTTTISKLGLYFKEKNYKVLFAAGDTFRAGATEQLQILGNKLNIPVFTKSTQTTDPAALIYKSYLMAQEENFDILIADTSGRFSNNKNLTDELKKIEKTLKKIDPHLPHESILVLDSSIGQASLPIAEGFLSVINITGLIFTKVDGNKGGSLIPVATKLNLPILFLGNGEKSYNLIPFKAEEFSTLLMKEK